MAHLPFIGIRGKPNFFVFSGSWDGWFYRFIAEHGYPATLLFDSAGNVLPNESAFEAVFLIPSPTPRETPQRQP